MNNYAFSYNISVPMHIILRSAGSITTIAVGWLWGKRFSRVQVLSVAALTVGVVLAAYSDAASKSGVPHPLSPRSPPSDSSASTYTSAPASSTPGAGTPSALPDFSAGLLVLFIAMVLSAIMGIYTEETYREYGPQWKENLFYSHFLGLPLFIPLIPRMWATWQELAGTPALVLPWHGWGDGVGAGNMGGWAAMLGKIQVPEQIAFLAVNVFTQYACIRGVNLLASASSALTVTIVLNVRKLVSLLLSIWLFGNQLSSGVLLGAVIVFGSGAVYSLDRGGRKAVRRVDRGHLRMESRAGENGKSG